jgi:hypothetical protein
MGRRDADLSRWLVATRSMNGGKDEANVYQEPRRGSTAGVLQRTGSVEGTSQRAQRGRRGAVTGEEWSYLKRGRCGVVAVGVDFPDSSLLAERLVPNAASLSR